MRKLIVALCGVLGSLLIQAAVVGALTINTAQDCDDNAVIRCGLSNTNQLSQFVQQGTGLPCLFKYMGIGSQDVNSFNAEAVQGQVTKTGNVIVNGKIVATDAMTAGRQNMSGSHMISCGGTDFFIRRPSVSFASSSLEAFVVMRNNQFAYAILASCGNPVEATPLAPKATPTPTAPTTPQTPTQTQTQSQSQSVTVNVPAAQVQSAVTSVPAKALPNTGPGGVLALGGVTTVFGTLGHWLISRRRLLN